MAGIANERRPSASILLTSQSDIRNISPISALPSAEAKRERGVMNCWLYEYHTRQKRQAAFTPSCNRQGEHMGSRLEVAWSSDTGTTLRRYVIDWPESWPYAFLCLKRNRGVCPAPPWFDDHDAISSMATQISSGFHVHELLCLETSWLRTGAYFVRTRQTPDRYWTTRLVLHATCQLRYSKFNNSSAAAAGAEARKGPEWYG